MPKIGGISPTQPVTNVPRFPVSRSIESTGSQIANIMQRRGLQLLERYDKTKAIDAYTQFSSMARDKMQELTSLRGKDAVGSLANYKSWFQQESSRISKENLDSSIQQEIYSQYVHQASEADMDALSRHELQQDLAWRNDEWKAVSEIADLKVRQITNNKLGGLPYGVDEKDRFADVDEYIASTRIQLNELFPGMNNRQQEILSERVLRMAQMEEIMAKNPQMASEWLEKYKGVLGEEYHNFMTSTKEKTKQVRHDIALARLMAVNGDNLEASIDWVNDPSRWGTGENQLDIDGEIAANLDTRLRGMRNERDYREEQQQKDEAEAIKRNDLALTVAITTGQPFMVNGEAIDVHTAARLGLISEGAYKWATEKQEEGPVDNNPLRLAEINRAIVRRDFVRARTLLDAALKEGHIKDETYITTSEEMEKKGYADGLKHVDRVLEPSAADPWNYEAHRRWADAHQLFQDKIRGGMDYRQASLEVVDQYVGQQIREIENLPRPRTLKGSKTDFESLENAKLEVYQQYMNEIIGPDEYRAEIANIERIQQLVLELEQMQKDQDAVNKEVNRRFKD